MQSKRFATGVVNSEYRGFIFDMQGSILRFGLPVEGAASMLKELQNREVPFVILTNEDRDTTANITAELKSKLAGVDLDEKHIFTASQCMAHFFRRKLLQGWQGSIYVIGEEGLLSSLQKTFADFEDLGCYVLHTNMPEPGSMLPVDFVVVGSVFATTASGTYYMQSLERACAYASAGAKIVCSCPDDYEVNGEGEAMLGSPGPAVGLLERVTGKSSYAVGKPRPQMLWFAWSQMVEHYRHVLDLQLSESLFIGDSLNTDIRLALEHDLDCALVLSGITKHGLLAHSPLTPTFVFDSVAGMYSAYTSNGLLRETLGRESSSFRLSPSQISDVAGNSVARHRCLIFDMDGVIQRFGEPIDGAAHLLRDLLDEEVPFIIMTNEDRYTNQALLARLRCMLDDIKLGEQHLITASNAARNFFRKKLARGWRGSIYVIGEDGLLSNLREAFAGYEGLSVLTLQELKPEYSAKVDFVVIGSVYAASPAGTEYVQSLQRACAYASAGAKVICSCPDDYEVTEAGEVRLGSPGPTVSALQAVTGHSSYAVGKPNPQMLWAAWSQMVDHYQPTTQGLQLSDALFVGDSLATDIRTAVEHQIDCALVLSGTATAESLASSALMPTFVFDSIKELRHARMEAKSPK